MLINDNVVIKLVSGNGEIARPVVTDETTS